MVTWMFYQIGYLMCEYGLTLQIKENGLKIKTIGSKEQKILKTNFQINSMKSLQKVSSIKELAFYPEA